MSALDTFRGIEPLDISNITGDPSACGMPDVYGNIAYFNRLCIGTTPIGGPPKLANTGTSQPNNNQAVTTLNQWVDVFYMFGTSPITIPATGFWYLWAEINMSNAGGTPVNVYHRIVTADGAQTIIASVFTIPANGYSSDTLLINVSTSLGTEFKTQIYTTANVTILGNQFINLPTSTMMPLGPVLVGLQIS